MKFKRTFLFIVAVLIFSIISVTASAQTGEKRVYDFKNLLSNDEEIELILAEFEENTGVAIRVVTTYDEYFHFSDINLSQNGDSVILEIIRLDGIYYYEFYTYGEANTQILDSEVDRILDNTDVYDNLKSGNFNKGIETLVSLTEKAYLGDFQEPVWKTVVISLVLSFIIGGIAVVCVVAKYKRKQKAPSYPLDKYTSLILDPLDRRDEFMGSRVIKTRVNNSSSGSGRSGGRSGGGSRGRR